MLTKSSSELTLFDTLSRLTFTRAAKLLGPKGNRLIATGGKFDIDLTTQVKFDRDMFRLTLDGAAVTLTLSPPPAIVSNGAATRARCRVSTPGRPSL
jgi:hypothetical protein